ncbi:molybdopterin molybdotransferase MoeA [Corynebacterium bovis]|uniref:molybdopterin molybdotransferase MoeA n=1 Tax=Corynebacterium bovis TaxID=36808 RepID=UPI002449841B|nr:molybdopterin molybdotransferase MoeA [Corynebacterium bovis]MDH2455670.1 molybdopterin molybdotransferase MoeA [Corynebacterium bovis]
MSTSHGRHSAAPGTGTGTHAGPHTGANPGTPGDGHAPGARTPEEHLAAVTEAVRGAVPGLHDAADGGVPVELAVGRTLVDAVEARVDSPPFDNSQMDGYALGAHHLDGGTFPVGRTLPAGRDPATVCPAGVGAEVVPVMTGARLPDGTAAVVPVEDCTPASFVPAGGAVTVPPTGRGLYIRRRGSDLRAGDVLFPAGHRVSPRTVGAAAAQGLDTVPVRRTARVLLCTGGDEIGGAGRASVPDANGPMLRALCRRHLIDVAGHVRTSDDPEEFARALDGAVREYRPTAVVTSGGISHGQFEVVRQVLEPRGGWFGHVAQQPGGPQGLAVVDGTPVIALPGNPVSTAVSFRLFVAPVLGEVPATVTARAGEPLAALPAGDGRCRFLRARTEVRDGVLTVTTVGGAGSHLLAQSAGADCLVRVRAGEDVAPGEVVEVYPL